jgi:hypothetical protein
MWNAANGNGFTDSFGNFFTVVYGWEAQPMPRCGECNETTLDNITNEGKPICKRCAFILGAPKWLDAMFIAIGRQRAKTLYRALAPVFHPDAGGDERLMKALNAAKERFT